MSDRPFLTSLGITELDQARAPSAAVFPTAFNEGARYIWESVIPLVIDTGNSVLDWAKAIKLYVEACEEQNVFPFNEPKPVNKDIVQSLLDARTLLLEFANSSDIWNICRPRGVERQVQFTSMGLVLSVCATYCNDDPSIGQWAESKGFQYDEFAREYVRNLSSTTKVYINVEQRRVGYNIGLATFPHVPGNDLPSREELEVFVLKTMWEPIVRQHRFSALTQRLL